MENRGSFFFRYFIAAGVGAALGLWPGRGGAADYYVAPGGPGPGTNWATALSNLQLAVNAASASGDVVYVKCGIYSNAAQVSISNHPGLAICGGYAGTNDDLAADPTVLTRAGGAMRILYAVNSTLTLAGVTVSGGYYSSGGVAGAGVYAQNCALALTNCVVRDNSISYSGSGFTGGGLYCSGASLQILGCLFSNNTLAPVGSGQNGSGGAVYAAVTGLTVVGTTFAGNRVNKDKSYGGALYHAGGLSVLISNCVFQDNGRASGGGNLEALGTLYLAGGVTATVAHCVFTTNSLSGGTTLQGGGLYAVNWPEIQVVSNVFLDNYLSGGKTRNGSSVYLNGCETAMVERCDFSSVSQSAGAEYIYVSGGGRTVIQDVTARNCSGGGGLYYNGGASGTLGMTNCVIYGNQDDGLTLAGGSALVMNCLVAKSEIGHGLALAAGTAVVANCTLADNGSWGVQVSGGTGTVDNSIAWGNAFGGFASNANLAVNYCCSQNDPYGGGTSNLTNDPLFVNAPGFYYLSVSGLTNQAQSSPCIDAGSNTAAWWGLTNRTTRTDGANDTGPVDLGYHYPSGIADGQILPLAPTNCYVDAVNGTNAANGLSWGTAWKTLSMALSNVAQDATIHVATGLYDAANGEIFPLTVQKVNLAIVASNANPALTVLDNGGTAGKRVFSASGKGTITLAGLTVEGGKYTSVGTAGAGVYLLSCGSVRLTNCIVRDNSISYSGSGFTGGGLYCSGASLQILGCLFSNNTLAPVGSGQNGSGGAVYAAVTGLTVVGTTFAGNRVNKDKSYGGALYHAGGLSVLISNCVFQDNGRASGGGNLEALGTLYLAGGVTATVAHCVFTTNSLSGGTTLQGGGLYAVNWPEIQVVSNVFLDNYLSGGSIRNGSGVYLSGCGTARVECCLLEGVVQSVGAEHACVEAVTRTFISRTLVQGNSTGQGICFSGSSDNLLGLSNCLVVRNAGAGLQITAGTATVANCTFAHNAGWGIARPTSAGLTLKNSIIWGNALGGIGHNHNLMLDYTDAQDFWAPGMGAGNFSVDPLFVNPAAGDFHLQSTAGSWHGGAWTPDARLSPCIDAGDPASDWSLEPKPSGGRVNLGAYGNTQEASKSVQGMVFWAR